MSAARWVAAAGVLALLTTFGIALAARATAASPGPTHATGGVRRGPGSRPAGMSGRGAAARDTGAVQLTIGTYGRPGPPLSLTATGPSGRVLTRGGLPAGWHQGVVRIPVRRTSSPSRRRPRVRAASPPRPRGSTIALGGNTERGLLMEVAGRPCPARACGSTTCAGSRILVWAAAHDRPSLLDRQGRLPARLGVGGRVAAGARHGLSGDPHGAAQCRRRGTGHMRLPSRGPKSGGAEADGTRPRRAGARGWLPRAAWACAAVALLNGLAWSLITPPFQVPDENAHYAYVQELAERGKLPRMVTPEGFFSPAEDEMLATHRLLHDRRQATQPRALLDAPAAPGRRTWNGGICARPAAATPSPRPTTRRCSTCCRPCPTSSPPPPADRSSTGSPRCGSCQC